MFRLLQLIGILALLTAVSPLSAQESAPTAQVSGTVAYLQRNALPPDAVVRVRLEDVTYQDVPALIINEAIIPSEGKQVPIPFRIPYEPGKIDPAHRYHVRATIRSGEQLLFTSTTVYPVITRSAPSEVAIMVQPVGRSSRQAAVTLMEGSFVYFADAGLFTDCRTGKRYPVAQEADNAALERAYRAARNAPGAPVIVAVDGRIERRPKIEGAGDQEMLIVRRFDRVVPGGFCPSDETVSLEGTFWTLTELRGNPAEVNAMAPAAHLMLQSEGNKLSGSSGCNRLFGVYEVADGRLKLIPTGMTMMACPDPLMKQEQAFVLALNAVTGYVIDSTTLTLLAGEDVAARFTATPPQ